MSKIDPDVKLWKASARITIYVLAKSEDDVESEFRDFVGDEVRNNGITLDCVAEVPMIAQAKLRIPVEWLDTIPYVACELDNENMTLKEYIDAAREAETERMKTNLKEETCEPS